MADEPVTFATLTRFRQEVIRPDFERSLERFQDALIRHMDARFEAVDRRFEGIDERLRDIQGQIESLSRGAQKATRSLAR